MPEQIIDWDQNMVKVVGSAMVIIGSVSTSVDNVTGSVAVVDVVPGTGASNLGKTEDTAHSTGHVGVMVLGVRNDTNTTLSDTAGDYTPIAVSPEGNVRSVGNRAHDAVDSGNPMKVGGKAYSSTPSAVDANDRVNAYFDTTGHQRIKVDSGSILAKQDGAPWSFLGSVWIDDGSVVVTATDLDIRNLLNATDSVEAHQGGAWTVSAQAAQAGTWSTVALDGAENAMTSEQPDGALRGLHTVDLVKRSGWTSLDNVNAIYHTAGSIQNSQDIDVADYRYVGLAYTLFSSGNATDIQIKLQQKNPNGAYHDYTQGFWGANLYDDATIEAAPDGALSVYDEAQITGGSQIRVRVECTGTTSGSFIVSGAAIYLRN